PRFLLTRINQGVGFRVLREERVQTRLGSGAPGRLPQDSVDSTLRAAHRFLAGVNNGARPRVVAVATSAVREADNREWLLGPLRTREGVTVKILSGRQEGRLGGLAALSALPVRGGGRVRCLEAGEEARRGALAALSALPIRDGAIADLGGSSLQVSRVRAGRPIRSVSLPLGAVPLTRRCVTPDPPRGRDLQRSPDGARA